MTKSLFTVHRPLSTLPRFPESGRRRMPMTHPTRMCRASDRRKSMNRKWRRWLFGTGLASLLLAATAWAQEPPIAMPQAPGAPELPPGAIVVPEGDKKPEEKPKEEEEHPESPGHTLQRAGNPQILSHCAVEGDTGAYVIYQVGG